MSVEALVEKYNLQKLDEAPSDESVPIFKSTKEAEEFIKHVRSATTHEVVDLRTSDYYEIPQETTVTPKVPFWLSISISGNIYTSTTQLYIGSRLETVRYVTDVSNIASWISGITFLASYSQRVAGYTLGSYASGNLYPRSTTLWAKGTLTWGLVVNEALHIIEFYTEDTYKTSTLYY